jgi:hypothetical protein
MTEAELIVVASCLLSRRESSGATSLSKPCFFAQVSILYRVATGGWSHHLRLQFKAPRVHVERIVWLLGGFDMVCLA